MNKTKDRIKKVEAVRKMKIRFYNKDEIDNEYFDKRRNSKYLNQLEVATSCITTENRKMTIEYIDY